MTASRGLCVLGTLEGTWKYWEIKEKACFLKQGERKLDGNGCFSWWLNNELRSDSPCGNAWVWVRLRFSCSFLLMHPGRQQLMAQVLGFLPLWGRLGISSCSLALAWPSSWSLWTWTSRWKIAVILCYLFHWPPPPSLYLLNKIHFKKIENGNNIKISGVELLWECRMFRVMCSSPRVCRPELSAPSQAMRGLFVYRGYKNQNKMDQEVSLFFHCDYVGGNFVVWLSIKCSFPQGSFPARSPLPIHSLRRFLWVEFGPWRLLNFRGDYVPESRAF